MTTGLPRPFQRKDAERLQALRQELVELEKRQGQALHRVRAVLEDAGLCPVAPTAPSAPRDNTSDDVPRWVLSVVRHADAIRDALDVFDSGVRCADEVAR